MFHIDWIETVKSRKAGEPTPLLPHIFALHPSYLILKHVLLKVAFNSKLESDKLITLHDMLNYRIPADLIKLYYDKIKERLPNNEFATCRVIGFDGNWLDYLLAGQSVLQTSFPREYIRAFANLIQNSSREDAHIDRAIAALLKVYESTSSEVKFTWLPTFAYYYKSNLSDAQLSRLLPIFNDYWLAVELRQIAPLKIVLCSHQLMLLMFTTPNNSWAPRYFLWFLSDLAWFKRRSNQFKLLNYLRDDAVAIPWILGSLKSYLPTLGDRLVSEKNLARFFRRMMNKDTWLSRTRWNLSEDIIKGFLAIVTPGSQRKLVGFIFYPHSVSRAFLNYDYDYESTDIDVIKYNFLKMRLTVQLIA